MGRLHGFERRRGGVRLGLDESERSALLTLLGQLEELVRPESPDDEDPMAAMLGIDADADEPEDEAVARLFPNAYRDDDESAAEFRRFTEWGLRDRRMAQCSVLRDVVQRARPGGRGNPGDLLVSDLSDEECTAVLGVLNDLRLVLGTRLGIRDDDDNREDYIAEDDPRAQMLAVYQWLTWLQSELLNALVR